MTTLPTCTCGDTTYTIWATVKGFPLVRCNSCKTIRVFQYPGGFVDHYVTGDYHAEGDYHESGKALNDRFEHDVEVAKLRYATIREFVIEGGNLLDIGCANGAFMDVASAEMQVHGCDLSLDAVKNRTNAYGPNLLHEGEVTSCMWPRRTFQVITMFDVLEHMPDPVRALKVVQGLLRRDGILIVEIPDMGCTDALTHGPNFKHVKPPEHLWYWSATQLRALLQRLDFNVLHVFAPISGKATLVAMPSAVVTEVTIYGPPGVGDTLWTLVKLKGIREKEAPCKIKYVVSSWGSRKAVERSKDFLNLCRLIDTVDFRQEESSLYDIGNRDQSQPVYELIANSWLEPGRQPLVQWRPELPTDWDVEIDTPGTAIIQACLRLRKIKQPIVAFYISSLVWNQVVAFPDWTAEHYAELFIKLADNGYKPLILGADYDVEYAREVAQCIENHGRKPAEIWLNMIGTTTLPLAMAYMQIAHCTVGIANGLPMIAAWKNWPTIILWPQEGVSNTREQWGPEFQTNWIPPYVTRYTPMTINRFTVEDLFKEIDRLAHCETAEDGTNRFETTIGAIYEQAIRERDTNAS